MKNLLRKISNKIISRIYSPKWSIEGNRSSLIINFNKFLSDPKIFKYVTEFQSTSYFTGHLINLTEEEENYVKYLKDSIHYMNKNYPVSNFGMMWADLEKKMVSNILKSDLRFFNHAGSLSYKTFAPSNLNYEDCVLEVIKTLCLHYHLSISTNNFEVLHTNLNSGYITKNNIKLNSKLKYYEEYSIIKNLIKDISEQNKDQEIKILEIGWGEGQLANIILNESEYNAKYVLIDLPSMHSRAPYFIYKNSNAKVCTYLRYIEMNCDLNEIFKVYDVVMLPPWETEKLMDFNFDLAINCRSISEMNLNEASKYLDLISNNSDYFFSINTNKDSFDLKTQKNLYDELNILELIQNSKSDFQVIKTGATIGDSLFFKSLHHVYAILKNIRRVN